LFLIIFGLGDFFAARRIWTYTLVHFSKKGFTLHFLTVPLLQVFFSHHDVVRCSVGVRYRSGLVGVVD
jgi:hypothetical protein